jgi:transcriptional regulator with XRE-family HTH domain
MSIGSKLRQLRLKRSESLQDVADAVKASKAHIWEIETGKSKNPSLGLLTGLADHFNVSVSHLTGEAPDKNSDGEELLVMYRTMKNLSQEDRATLQLIIESMKKKGRR